ncbi:MAG: hypothetical protein JNL70_00260 [Saprospiraceae bacterium]|nr:hypothetical protein [Saprospiraceae bacterium]
MEQLKQAIRQLANTNEAIYSVVGTVKKVDKQTRTCVVSPENGDADILDARLQANTEGSLGVVVFPKEGSFVVVTFLNKNTAYVALTDEVETVHLSREGFDLKEQINDLFEFNKKVLDLLLGFKMLTNMGVTTGVFPDTITKLQQLKQENDQLKSKFNKILE